MAPSDADAGHAQARERGGGEEAEVMCVCVHGKSRHRAVWSLRALLRSCNNLCCPRADGRMLQGMVAPSDLSNLRGILLSLYIT
jgi:hypothetical protein